MSFDLIETSISDGRPIRLYLFERGAAKYAYCSGEKDVVWDAVTYQSTQITDDGIRLSSDSDADTFDVTAPADFEVAEFFRFLPPSGEIVLTVRDLHFNLDDEPVALVAWVGSVHAVKWPALDRCKIICNNIATSILATGLRMTWARSCAHALFGRGCNLNKQDFETEGVIASVSGKTITVNAANALPDGYFTGGFIEFLLPGGAVEMRAIEKHEGAELDILASAYGLSVDLALKLYPGCPRTIAVCASRFNNKDNFGGNPGLPGRSPFDGNPVF